jgi:DNA polymerase III delta prime subunit
VERTDQTEFTARVATILVEENVDFDLDTLDMYVKVAYPDLRKCINLVQQNVNESKLAEPNKGDAGEADWKFDMVELFKAGKITEARKMLCGKIRSEEMEDVYRWLYDNITIFGDDERQDKAIIIIKQGLVDHTLVVDTEINLAATLVKLARL